MTNNNPVLSLKIYTSSTDKLGGGILNEQIVIRAKEQGLAGATVTRGIMGYGASSVIHSYKFWEIADKLPVIVEIIDEEEKVRAFYESIRAELEKMRYGCLVTISPVEVILSKGGRRR
jgi:PII-like signaling protein